MKRAPTPSLKVFRYSLPNKPMIHPNIVMDAPPTSLEVGGLSYSIETDFRVWIDVLADMKKLLPVQETDMDILHNAEIITFVSIKLMGKPIKWESMEQIADFIAAVAKFSTGYPQPPVSSSGTENPVQTYSFDYDINAIAIAFKKYYGIDITYANKEPLHWWLFLEYFRNLCGDDLLILKLMEIRGYTGKDKELRKQAARFALPIEQTEAEKRMMDDIADEFYGAH